MEENTMRAILLSPLWFPLGVVGMLLCYQGMTLISFAQIIMGVKREREEPNTEGE